MELPWSYAIGFGISFGSGAATGGTVGSYFGPLTLIGGMLVGGVLGWVAQTIYEKDKIHHYDLFFDTPTIDAYLKGDNGSQGPKSPIKIGRPEATYGPKDAQSPGVPTENDGFYPPKRWDGKKVKHPETGKYGWPDKKGRIWVPTGSGPLAHGGPHWDVQYPGGVKYDNVFPGGKIRLGR